MVNIFVDVFFIMPKQKHSAFAKCLCLAPAAGSLRSFASKGTRTSTSFLSRYTEPLLPCKRSGSRAMKS